MYNYNICPNCNRCIVNDLGVDVEVLKDSVVVENIVIKESTTEEVFINNLANAINNTHKKGIYIPNSISVALVLNYGVSPDYAKRVESLITPLLVSPPICVKVKT